MAEDFNPTMALMRLFKVPLTRDNYLNIEHVGAPPKEVHPELEADMPKRFRHPIIHSNMMPEPYMTEAQKEAEKAQAQDIVIGGDKKPGAKVLPNKNGIAPSLDTDNPPVAQGYVDMNTNRAPLGNGKGVMDTRIPMVKDWDPQPREQ